MNPPTRLKACGCQPGAAGLKARSLDPWLYIFQYQCHKCKKFFRTFKSHYQHTRYQCVWCDGCRQYVNKHSHVYAGRCTGKKEAKSQRLRLCPVCKRWKAEGGMSRHLNIHDVPPGKSRRIKDLPWKVHNYSSQSYFYFKYLLHPMLPYRIVPILKRFLLFVWDIDLLRSPLLLHVKNVGWVSGVKLLVA